MKKILFIILLFPITVFALKPSEEKIYSAYPYVIDSYNIDIKVNENNTYDIIETIDVYFNQYRHGIYRTLPLKNKVVRLDKTESTNRAIISNVSVNDMYSTSIENNDYKIKIGNENKTIAGSKQYIIKYTYDIGNDKNKNYDEFYFNLIGNEWDTVISNITFTINMPKAFDSKKLGFSHGLYGSTDSNGIEYNIDGNIITGSYNKILDIKEGLTVRLELDEGYFINKKLNISECWFYGLPIIFLIISIILWNKYGRDEEVIETVEFYPPTGYNSLEIGFLYKGTVNNEDIVSLLVYLANLGYIKIIETEKKSIFSKKRSFKIKKIKEYDGNNINEKCFLDGLFACSSDLNEVSAEDLYNKFYITMNSIKSNIISKDNKNKIFEEKSLNKKIYVVLMIILTYCLITIPPMIKYEDTSVLMFSLIFPSIGFTVFLQLFLGNNSTVYINGKSRSSIVTKFFGLIWGLGFGGIPWFFMVYPILSVNTIYLIGYFIGLCSVVGMTICLKYLPKRTSYGNEMLGKTKGLKNFLETAEKSRLESLVMENPTYFYDILPYSYVLGVSDKWIKKFETISLTSPSWYYGDSDFNITHFGSFMNNTFSQASSAMSSSPSSSSGGGSSGGGSGGGGGGSW